MRACTHGGLCEFTSQPVTLTPIDTSSLDPAIDGYNDGCPNGGTATSNAFPRTNLTPISGANDTSKGTATVDADARPGSYDITVHCSGRSLTRPAAFTVIGGVRGGIGGSSTSGATPTDMAIGGALVAAAVAGSGVFWMRRRAEKRI